ncbi:MAG: hypothetical protein Q8P57_00095 [Candidatus Pacearchaeota archaeon]|nr:hypothetical protein [Candidatus Pacearchaeota archaeon]
MREGKINNTFDAIKLVFEKTRYKVISIVLGILFFGFLYYLLVVNVADKDIWISVMMSGEGFVTFSVVSLLLISSLSAILISMILFKFDNFKSIERRGFFGFIGSGVGVFGVGCPTCGAFLFGLVGMPLALTYLPFKGLELQVLSVIILMISIYLTGKSIKGVCEI